MNLLEVAASGEARRARERSAMNLESWVMDKITQGALQPATFRGNLAARLHKILENPTRAGQAVAAAATIDGTYSRNLERAIYNASLAKCERLGAAKLWSNSMFVDVYLRTFHYVLYALEYTHIHEAIRAMEIRPHALPFMTHQEIFPQKWASLLDNKVKREQNMFKSNVQASTDSYTCRRCKGKECTFYQMQTRSADEPMTIFISCIVCGNQWKQ